MYIKGYLDIEFVGILRIRHGVSLHTGQESTSDLVTTAKRNHLCICESRESEITCEGVWDRVAWHLLIGLLVVNDGWEERGVEVLTKIAMARSINQSCA
jgi:hypothetical protein